MKAEKKPVRQSFPRTGLPRIYRIDKEIASGRFPNSDDLARMCETSVSTISRDIEFMHDQLRAPVEYDAQNRGYFYTLKTFRLPAGFTTSEDLLALNMAKSIFSLYRDTPLYEASKNLMDSILTPIVSDGNRDWLEDRINVPRKVTAKVDEKIWGNLISALKQNRVIIFNYLGTRDNEPRFRKIHPYQLLFDSGAWYLYGFSEERKNTRIFSLSRITDAKLANETFTLPKNYNYSDLTGDSYFGVYIGQVKRTFNIEFYGDTIAYICERLWAKDQKIVKHENYITLEFSSTQYDKVLKWVLSCGCYALPVKPKKLVDDWSWNVLEMMKNIKK